MSIRTRLHQGMTRKPEQWLTWMLSALIALLLGVYGIVQVLEQQQVLHAAEERRGLALARGLSLIGATAVMENLFVVQEAIMTEIKNDPEILNILVLDNDSMVIASSDLNRIGETIISQAFKEAKASQEKSSLVSTQGQDFERLIVFSPLQAESDLLGWIRVELSLDRVRQEVFMSLVKQVLVSLLVIFLAVFLVRRTVRRLSYALTDSEAKTHLIIENALDAVVGMNEHGCVTDWNSKAESMFGWTKDEVMGKLLSELIVPPAYRDKHQEGLKQFLVTGRGAVLNRRIEVPACIRDGQLITIELSISPIHSENGWSFHAFLRDITQRKSMEENLVRLSAFPQNNPNPIIQTDLNAVVTYLNPSAKERLSGLKVGSVDHPFLSGLSQIIAKFLEGPETAHNIEKSFNDSIYEVNISYISEANTITLYVHDVTQRKLVEADLGVSRDEALAAAKAKSEFLATMSHEIRTPMNGVIGMTGLLLESSLTADQQRFAETVRSSGEALLTIINDILDFSKIEAGKLDFEYIDFDLRVCVDETLELLAEKAGAKHLELVGIVFSDVPTALRGDPGRIRQVFLNLLGNAIKFTEFGEVTIQVLRLDEMDDEVVLRCQVTDTGVGIPFETQSKLFQPFTQADSSTTRKYGGTGLGLAISKQLVEQMNGEIGVDSVPGVGSQFWFTVRLAKQSVDSHAAGIPTRNLEGLRVCCVDDHPINRFLLAQYCSDWGIDAVVAGNPREALCLMQAATQRGKPFDLAILDMEMPEMDGKGLAAAIHADPTIDSVRLVLLTSLGQRGEATKARDAGFVGYLLKPIRKEKLQSCLEMVMGITDVDPFDASPFLITEYSQPVLPTMRNATVLVADDHAVNQQLAMLLLERMGQRVDVVSNGQEAVDAVFRQPYDVVFMDCQMPEMDGYDATREIRYRESLLVKRGTAIQEGHALEPRSVNDNQSAVFHIPIIAMTANAMQGDREKCLAAGMDDYLSKPLKADEIAKMLLKWLSSPDELSPIKHENDTGETCQHRDDSEGFGSEVDSPTKSSEGLTADTGGAEKHSASDCEETFHEWRMMTGEQYPTFLAKIVQQFVEDAGKCIEHVQLALSSGDLQAIREAAHGLKGIAGNVGALRLQQLALEIEELCRESLSPPPLDSFSSIESEFEHVRGIFAQELAQVSKDS